MNTPHILWYRKKVEVNTDPQRRCYDGCHFSSEMRWTAWAQLVPFRHWPDNRAEALASAVTYQTINPNSEYRVLPEGETPQ